MSEAWTGSSAARTYTVGGPCGVCGHPWDVHDVVCRSEDCPDAAPMCLDCIADGKPAFHHYAVTPIVLEARA